MKRVRNYLGLGFESGYGSVNRDTTCATDRDSESVVELGLILSGNDLAVSSWVDGYTASPWRIKRRRRKLSRRTRT